MGYMKHDALIVTSWDPDALGVARAAMVSIAKANASTTHVTHCYQDGRSWDEADTRDLDYASLISEPIPALTNGEVSFVVMVPDGSKEGWSTSDQAEVVRAEIIKWLKDNPNVDWALVRFGGDDKDVARITGASDESTTLLDHGGNR